RPPSAPEGRSERLHPTARVNFREDIRSLQGKARRLVSSKFIQNILQVDQRKLRIRKERHDGRTVDNAEPTGVRGEVRLEGSGWGESGVSQRERGDRFHEQPLEGMI